MLGTIWQLPVYLATGAIAGLLAGLLGVGGGLVLVPALVWLLPLAGVPEPHLMHMATGTSLAAIVLTSAASARAHQRRGGIQWAVFWQLAPTLALGAWLAGQLAARLSSATLSFVFAVFVVWIAQKMWRSAQQEMPPRQVFRGLWTLAGSGIGLLSGLVGIGGGSLVVPLLNRHGYAMSQAVATSALCGLPIALFGAIGYVMSGWQQNLPAGSTGFVYWPAVAALALASMLCAPLGARLAHRWPATRLKKVFAGFLSIVALLLMLRWLQA